MSNIYLDQVGGVILVQGERRPGGGCDWERVCVRLPTGLLLTTGKETGVGKAERLGC